jgi:putative ABC transport system substrate-binding protein
MRRRNFIALLGGAAGAWPLAARAQQSAMPVIAYLSVGAPVAHLLAVFKQSLAEAGFVEGRNVAIETPSADGHYDRLPALAVDLVRRQVAVIVAITANPALAAKEATATIPIVFNIPEDPVELGLVASLARPGGNATGINFFSIELVAKRLEILREMVPATPRIAVLINPADAAAETMLKDVEAATRAMGLQIQVLKANTSHEIDAAFATFVRERPDALLVSGGPFLLSRRVQLALLAARYAIPASYGAREYVEIGGLMSYGANIADAYRQVGVYAGRILKGAKPAGLPVMQSTKFELVINAQAARVLGLDVPPTLLARTDEVIE